MEVVLAAIFKFVGDRIPILDASTSKHTVVITVSWYKVLYLITSNTLLKTRGSRLEVKCCHLYGWASDLVGEGEVIEMGHF